MNICFLTKSTIFHQIGGMETHCKNLSAGLTRQGHKVSIITTAHPSGLTQQKVDDVEYYYLQQAPSGIYSLPWWENSAKKLSELNSIEAFDITISQSIAAAGCLSFLKSVHMPLLTITHGLFRQHIKSELNQCSTALEYARFILLKIPEIIRYTLRYERKLLKNSDAIILVSNELIKLCQKAYGIKKERLFLVYNGVDFELFKPDAEKKLVIRNKYNIPDSAKVILMLGVLSKQKGFHIGIKAFAKIKNKLANAKMMIVGNGSYLPELKKLAEKLNLSKEILFCGSIKNEEAPFYYNASDLFILPSLRAEGSPFVIEEAMSCQVPAIASYNGGSALIDHGINGMLVPCGNTEILSESMLKLLLDEKFSETLSNNAYSKAMGRFSIKKMASDIINISNSIINAKNRL